MKLTLRQINKDLQVFQLFLFFLVSLNFKNLYFYLIFLTFSVCLITNFRSFKVDLFAVLLALFSVCYILFYPPTRGSYTSILKQFSYPMCYLVGLNLIRADESGVGDNATIERSIKSVIYITSFGTLLHYLLNASINMTSILRNTNDYWTGEIQSATSQALLAVMSISIFCVWLFASGQKWKKILSLAGLVLIFVYNFILAGRTIVILGTISMCIAFMFVQTNSRTDGRIKNYLFLCALIVCTLLLFLNNAWGMREWILDSNLSERFDSQGMLTDVRFQRKKVYFSLMGDFLLGGGELKTAVGGYAHELYLDVYSDVGVLGYLIVVIVAIAGGVNFFKAFKCKSLSVETRGLILCVFTGINFVFFLEPILQGEPWFFCIYCLLIGIFRNSFLLKQKEYID